VKRSTLTITVGLPGSGKSTWARQQQALDPNLWRVNRDDLRAMTKAVWPYGKPEAADHEDLLTAVQLTTVRVLLDSGVDVVVDDTHLVAETVQVWSRLAARAGAHFAIQAFTHVGLEECIARDAARDKPVGAEVIRRMHSQYLAEGSLS
jgi:predicted kinase